MNKIKIFSFYLIISIIIFYIVFSLANSSIGIKEKSLWTEENKTEEKNSGEDKSRVWPINFDSTMTYKTNPVFYLTDEISRCWGCRDGDAGTWFPYIFYWYF